MDLGDPDETTLLIHSKFWKARRGSAKGGPLTPDTPPLPPQTNTKNRLPPPAGHMTSTAHLPRIEQGQAIDSIYHSRSPRRALSSSPGPSFRSEVFRFDSTDRERYLISAISEEEEVFSPGPRVRDSPAITISPLCLKGTSPPSTPDLPLMDSQNHLMARVHTGIAMLPTSAHESAHSVFGIPSSPISPLTPNTPLSPSPLFSESLFQQGFLAELYRRRCHSDSDLPLTPESCRNEPTDLSVKSRPLSKLRKGIPHPLTMPSKGGSLESDQSSPQDSPLDLSVRGGLERYGGVSNSCESLSSRFLSSLAIPHSAGGFSPVAVIRGDIASPSTRDSVALRYNLDVSPVVETMAPGTDMAFVCPICGQMFSLHDRLAKHMASRHKSKPHDPNKSYPCDVCHRSFARSDMLTRHMRLHTGVKPYTCRVCGQVFSRSDHLSTHQRTHTGEKPYKCPQCPYSACRRDMITRHLRTHSRTSSSSSSDLMTQSSGSFSTSDSVPSSMDLDDRPIKMELEDSRPMKIEYEDRPMRMELERTPRPPSSTSSLPPDSPHPLSPALNLGSLSVNSPASPSLSKD